MKLEKNTEKRKKESTNLEECTPERKKKEKKLCLEIRHSAGSTIQSAERQLSTRPTWNISTLHFRGVWGGAMGATPGAQFYFPIVSARRYSHQVPSVFLFLS
jgi:hypothetical protein